MRRRKEGLDRLDAALDGRLVEVDDELAPLVETAAELRAALTVVPVTMASASALPGQALYPVKLAVEQLQVTAASWSSTREADERIRIADNRLDELNRLTQLSAADRILPAIVRLHQAYADAQQAVAEVVRDTGNLSQMRALEKKLAPVGATLERLQDQGMLPTSAQQALPAAIEQPPVTLGLTGIPQPTPPTAGPVATTPAGSPTQAPT